MSTTAPEPATLVRLTVLCRHRRADLAVPGSVAVADLLPELASSVGALDAYLVHGGYQLVQADGEVLQPGAGLTAQGVDSGAVLTLQVGAEAPAERVYDDVVEAVADTVEAQIRPWDTAASRRTALSAAALLLVLAAVTLGVQRASGLPVAVVAGALAVVLLVGAAVLTRAQQAHEEGVVVAVLAAPFAAVAGLAAVPDEPVLRLPLALAGLAVLVAGVVGALAVSRREALLPSVVVGAAAACTGGVLASSTLRPAAVVAFVLVIAVGLGSLVPLLTLAAAKVRAPAPNSDADIVADPAPVDPREVAGQVRLGRGLLLGLSVSLGLLLVLAAPFVVQLGLPGALLGIAACVVALLRTRQSRSRVDVVVGMTSGVAGLVALSVAACALQPQWREALSGLLVLVGVVLLVVAVVPRPPSARLGRLGDLAEGVALTALLPLLVVATGIVAAVRR